MKVLHLELMLGTSRVVVLSGPADREVLIDKFNIDMTRKKISCLKPKTWLNDEVMSK